MNKIPLRQFKETFSEERFSIRDIESLVAEKDLNHELHRHDFYLVLFIKNGKGDHEIDFINYEVGNYSVFFVRPGQVHKLNLKKESSGFLLQFTTDFYFPREKPSDYVLRKVSNKNHCLLSLDRFDKIVTLLDYIFLEFTQKQDRYKEVIKASLEILFIELARQSQNPDKILNETSLYTQERIAELMELLEKNIALKKQVSQYAEMLNVTPYQLNSITKTALNKTCSEVINEHIILEAKRLLIATSNQVNQIADMVGYEDQSYFIRFFKKHTGSSPEVYRMNYK